MSGPKVLRVSGRSIAVTGDDIDTDRIMPARFLKAVTFEGLEAHLFEDDRRQAAERSQLHPFDDPDRHGARVLVVGSNFGCGSSREHAPQALVRWGIRAVVGESFAEIFFGNALMLGLPCVRISPEDLVPIRAVAQNPTTEIEIDLATGCVTAGSVQVPFTMPGAAREALISGAWDATGMLLADYEHVRRTASRLPYITQFN